MGGGWRGATVHCSANSSGIQAENAGISNCKTMATNWRDRREQKTGVHRNGREEQRGNSKQ